MGGLLDQMVKKLTSATLALAWAELGNNADQEEIMQVLEVMMQVVKVKMIMQVMVSRK